jgi:hypothetical protein
MNRLEFKLIRYFTPEEITSTGATLDSVQLELILAYDKLRKILNMPIYFVYNGFTTGDHKSKYHKSGEAGDSAIPKVKRFQTVFTVALECGFRGIGFYYNENTKTFSFHLDVGKEYRQWKAIKKKGSQVWTYSDLILAPDK